MARGNVATLRVMFPRELEGEEEPEKAYDGKRHPRHPKGRALAGKWMPREGGEADELMKPGKKHRARGDGRPAGVQPAPTRRRE